MHTHTHTCMYMYVSQCVFAACPQWCLGFSAVSQGASTLTDTLRVIAEI